jgi:hypothetical protein
LKSKGKIRRVAEEHQKIYLSLGGWMKSNR